MLVAAPGAVVQGGDQDPLVQVRRGPRHRQGAQQPQDARAAADLGGAGGATLDVGGQPGGICRSELIEQEGVDERTSACAIQGVADMRVRHITYMT